MTRQDAEQIAIQALGFVAGDAVLLPRFLALTGITASAIRQAARQPGFLAGVLDFVLAHEPTLLEFAEAAGLPAGRVIEARRALPHGDDRYDRST
ncbi:MAG: DUF3572 domain-containing protein [Rhizobiaceae bacterium]|nr:DUF3572 domain-containing protein [Rhizobiaceae bacterium]